MSNWIKSLLAPFAFWALAKDPIRLAGHHAIMRQLWPGEGEAGHPWASLYDDNEKQRIAAGAMDRVSAIAAAPDRIGAIREWVSESVLLLAEFGVLAFERKSGTGSHGLDAYPGVTGMLMPHLDDIVAKKYPQLLDAAQTALREIPSQLGQFNPDPTIF